MNIPTKLNIGDTIWTFRFGEIKSHIIGMVYITVDSEKTKIHYSTTKYDNIEEYDEGKIWWRTREAVVDHINKNIIPEKPKSSEGLFTLKKNLLEKIFGDS